MRRCIFKAVATLAVVSFVVMTSSISASCTEDGWYTANETDKLIEDFNKDMAAQGWIVDNSVVGGANQDPKVAHPTAGTGSGEANSKTVSSDGWYDDTNVEEHINKVQQELEDAGYTLNQTYDGSTNQASSKETPTTNQTTSTVKEAPNKPVKACEHTYVDSITKEPTCVEEGTKTFTCETCGDSYEESIPKTTHSYESTIAEDVTCTTPGIRVYICSVCDDSYTEDIPASGHGKLETVIEDPAGLFTKGKQITRCTVCGEVIEEAEIPSKATDGFSKIGNFFKNLFA